MYEITPALIAKGDAELAQRVLDFAKFTDGSMSYLDLALTWTKRAEASGLEDLEMELAIIESMKRTPAGRTIWPQLWELRTVIRLAKEQ